MIEMVRKIALQPTGSLDLDHRAYFLRNTSHQSLIVAAAEQGQVSILTSGLAIRRVFTHPSKILGIAVHPSGHVAIADGDTGGLSVQTVDGAPVADVAAPPLHAGTPRRVAKGFEDCYFDESGDHLWAIARLSGDECEVQLLETKRWSLVSKALVADTFGESFCTFYPTGHSGVTCLWVAAGQDGQQVVWVMRAGSRITCKPEPCLANTTPPMFSPDGNRFLVANENNAICHFQFPNVSEIGSPLNSQNEDDGGFFDFPICYLSDRYALSKTASGRFFILGLSEMTAEAEVAIEGHEPRPTNEYYPTLAADTGICTDLSYAQRIGGIIVFVFRRNRGTDLKGWKDTLIWSPVTTICDLVGR